jgi:hypothetical protein
MTPRSAVARTDRRALQPRYLRLSPWALAALVCLWLRPTLALAAGADLIHYVDLRSSEDLPTDVCLVANSILERAVSKVGAELAPTTYPELSPETHFLLGLKETSFKPSTGAAACALDAEWCDAEHAVPECTSQFRSPPGSTTMACFSTLPDAAERRPLVLWIKGTLVQRPRMALNRIELTLSTGSEVAVLGGSFQPSRAGEFLTSVAVGEGRRLTQVTLEPRCLKTSLTFPFIPLAAPTEPNPGATDDMYVQLELQPEHAQRLERTVRRVPTGQDHLLLEIPNAPGARLTATLAPGTSSEAAFAAPAAGSEPRATKLVAAWPERSTPQRIDLLPQVFSFKWKRYCLYPKQAACPSVSIGGLCDPGTRNQNICTYRCNVPDGVAFPAPVRFHHSRVSAEQAAPQLCDKRPCRTAQLARPTSLSWQGQVERPGQVLYDYIEPAQRRMAVEYHWDEPPVDRNAVWHNRVDAVDIQLPSGTRWRLRPEWGDRDVPAPDLTCDDNATFQYSGARDYRVVGALANEGVLKLEDPSESLGRSVSFAFLLGAGLQETVGLERARVRQFGAAEAVFIFKPVVARRLLTRVELRASAIFGRQEYSVSSQFEGRPRTGFAPVLIDISYVRVPIEVLPIIDSGWVYVGGGTGVALGNHTFTRDSRRVLRRVLWPIRLLLGVHVSKYVSMELDGHAFFGENALSADYRDFSGDPEVRSDGAATYFQGLWLRLDDPL